MAAKLKALEEIFGDDFGDVIESFQAGIPEPLEALLLNVLDSIMFDIDVFTTTLTSAIANMESSGMAIEFILESLDQDLRSHGKIFGKLRNDVKANIVKGVNQSSRLGQYQKYFTSPILAGGKGTMVRDKLKYQWVTVTGHKICADCQARQGEIRTFSEWEKEGMPGAGMTVCGSYCYCVLDPVGVMGAEIEVPKDVEPEQNFSA